MTLLNNLGSVSERVMPLPDFQAAKMNVSTATCPTNKQSGMNVYFFSSQFFALQRSGTVASRLSGVILTARAHRFTIHLESAAFLFHINDATQGITGSLRAACSEPVQRFLACPFSLPKPTPQTRGCLKTPSPLLAEYAGRLLL